MEVHEAQKLNDLRKRMLENEAAGKPPHAGIDEEELREALDILRADRRNASVGAKPKAPKKILDPFTLFASEEEDPDASTADVSKDN